MYRWRVASPGVRGVAGGQGVTEAEADQADDKVMVKVGTPFATLDLKSFGVVLYLFDDETIEDLALRTRCLARMQNNTWLVAPARLVAAGVMVLRRFEVEI